MISNDFLVFASEMSRGIALEFAIEFAIQLGVELGVDPCDSSWVCKGIIADGCGTSSVFWNT